MDLGSSHVITAARTALEATARKTMTATEDNDCWSGAVGNDHDAVFQANLERIRRADAVFAYIDRAGAYGSAFEIGVAWALCLPTFVGFSTGALWRDDMWFPARSGVGDPRGHVGPVKNLWAQFCRTLRVTGGVSR